MTATSPTPIRIYIGTEPKTEIACRVMECSIRRRTDADVVIVPMIGPKWEYSLDGITVGTGFSLRRWMIPAFCNWEGRAIYCDADQICLDDIAKLWELPESMGRLGTLFCSYQTDKYYPQPAPQTSVMVIDCAAAKGQWQFELDKILAWLRKHTERTDYAKLMHGEFVDRITPISTRWNRLNAWVEGDMGILHYTKEDEQPWYKPDHPLAWKWRQELSVALELGYVTADMIREALANWGKKEDWRKSNGLHPDYKNFLASSQKENRRDLRPRGIVPAAPVKPAKPEKPEKPKYVSHLKARSVEAHTTLWVTAANSVNWQREARLLAASFHSTRSSGHVVLALDNVRAPSLPGERQPAPMIHLLHNDAWLKARLTQYAEILPKDQGGVAEPPYCRCPHGPLEPLDRTHLMPCLGHQVNLDLGASLRKVAALHAATALLVPGHPFTAIVWLEPTALLRGRVLDRTVEEWLRKSRSAFYLKGDKRPVLDPVAVGFSVPRGGLTVLEKLFQRYESGGFRRDIRWDFPYQLQAAITDSQTNALDVAGKAGDHSTVLADSPLAHYVTRSVKSFNGRKK